MADSNLIVAFEIVGVLKTAVKTCKMDYKTCSNSHLHRGFRGSQKGTQKRTRTK